MILESLMKLLYKPNADASHRERLELLFGTHDQAYISYLRHQLDRSLSKRNSKTGKGARILMDKILEVGRISPEAEVLCIGCRTPFEIEYLGKKGLRNVVGIDLFSSHPQVMVMDMHKMRWPDDKFDFIFSCHSLEHAFDVKAAASEIVRVARVGAVVGVEVPVRYEIDSADLIDFGSPAGILAAFETYVENVLWTDEQPPMSPTNVHGTPVARVIFSVKKS
jgi:SAM-dependent methyltransferase